jgi:Ca2+-binding RTX toxin-like protein
MRVRSVQHVLVTSAVLSLILGSASPTPAREPGTTDVRESASTRARVELPARMLVGSQGASVDRRVVRALEGGGTAEALLILDGEGALARARATLSEGDSRALLRSVVPAYRHLKDGVRSRLPQMTVLRDYRTLPILHVLLRSRAELDRAAADRAVVGIAANREYRATLAQSLPLIGQPTAAAAGHTGTGTAVAVLDSGVDHTRSAFGNCSGGAGSAGCKVVVSQDFAPNDGQLDDSVLHGTNVAGIVVGVAPDTGILALDVFDGSAASVADVLDAIDFTISNQATFNVRAMNLSLGDDSFNTARCGGGGNPFVTAFSNARAAGILPVVAAGNARFKDGSVHVGIANPACTPGAVSVGAVYDADVGPIVSGTGNDQCVDDPTAADKITCFSQVATFLTALAPGALINAAGVTQGGTSQASPHVAGAVAALADASPTATADMIETAIGSSGPLINDTLVNMSFHRLDVPAAITTLSALPPPPPPPPPGSCTIEGNDQSNFLEGTPGDDVICGEGGNDVILPSGGNDTVIGGPGFDYVSFENASAGAVVDLAAGTATAGTNSVTLEEVEAALGSPFADTLTGNGDQNEFFGLGGNDFIDGSGGFDFARYDFATKRILASLTDGVARGQGIDQLVGVEGLVGGSRSDELAGNNAINFLFGLAGDDLIVGFGKDDTLFGGPGADGLFGGRGNDDLLGGPGPDLCDQGPGTGRESSC